MTQEAAYHDRRPSSSLPCYVNREQAQRFERAIEWVPPSLTNWSLTIANTRSLYPHSIMSATMAPLSSFLEVPPRQMLPFVHRSSQSVARDDCGGYWATTSDALLLRSNSFSQDSCTGNLSHCWLSNYPDGCHAAHAPSTLAFTLLGKSPLTRLTSNSIIRTS